MRCDRRIILGGLTALSVVVASAAMWCAQPDRTTSSGVVLAATERAFNEDMSQPLVAWRHVAKHPGQYRVEYPGANYGELYVPLPFGRIGLAVVLTGSAMVPAVWLAAGAISLCLRHRLFRFLPLLSVMCCAGLLVWRVTGRPWVYRDSYCFGNFALLNGKPPPLSWYGVHETWGPLWVAVGITMIAPLMWLMAKLARYGWTDSATGFCRVCGYDLRATPDRCPECGSIAGDQGGRGQTRCSTHSQMLW